MFHTSNSPLGNPSLFYKTFWELCNPTWRCRPAELDDEILQTVGNITVGSEVCVLVSPPDWCAGTVAHLATFVDALVAFWLGVRCFVVTRTEDWGAGAVHICVVPRESNCQLALALSRSGMHVPCVCTFRPWPIDGIEKDRSVLVSRLIPSVLCPVEANTLVITPNQSIGFQCGINNSVGRC
jgi:hypothetical protein